MATPPSAKIDPAKVTKPIQLLGAWLAGLVIIDAAFLATACSIEKPPWACGLLVIAAVLNVPLFIFTIYRLQTRYRVELQEDSYYAKYLTRPQQLRRTKQVLLPQKTPHDFDRGASEAAIKLQKMLADED